MIEINPRISTIVYQEDLNMPYLGVKRALGEISDDELRALRDARPAGPDGAALLRPGRVGRVMPATLTGRRREWLSTLDPERDDRSSTCSRARTTARSTRRPAHALAGRACSIPSADLPVAAMGERTIPPRS